MTTLCVGIDIGGTNLKLGLLTDKGTMLEEHILLLEEEDKTEEGILNASEKAFRKVLSMSGFGVDSMVGVGIGVAGVIDTKRGIITQSPNFPKWKNFEFAKRFSEKIELPVTMENDVNAVARGEQWNGAVKGEKSFLCMAIGTGLGGALFINGNIWDGLDGMAAEFGHICIDPTGDYCNCGSSGCLETIASAVGLIKKVKQDDYRAVLDVVENDSGIPHKLAILAEKGEKQAQAYWDDFGKAIGLALAILMNSLNLHLVLLGGGLSKSFHLFEASMNAELKARAFPAISEKVEFKKSTLWENAGVYGAAAKLLTELKKQEKSK